MKKSLLNKSISLFTAVVLLGSLLSQSISAADSPSQASSSPIDKAKLHSLIRESILQSSPDNFELAANNDETLIAEDINTSSAEDINVIIQLSKQPAAVGRYAAKLGDLALAAEATEQIVQTEQTSFLSNAKAKGIPFKVNYQYVTVLNGMELTVRANQIPELAKIPGVKAIHKNLIYHPIEESDSSAAGVSNPIYDKIPLEQIGVDKAWDMGLTGEGMKVGVLDTGADYFHPDLKDAYAGGYDSFNQDEDPYEDTPDLLNSYPGSEHGTHVAGTIVGRFSNTSSVNVQKGVAYDAELYVYKVLGRHQWDTGGFYGTSATIIDGIEHAVKDGMDVINLSLGNSVEKDPNSPDSIALNNAVLVGVVAVVANGNEGSSGPYYYSIGSPASSQLVISVAAATSTDKRYSATVKGSVASTTYESRLDLISWTTDQEAFSSILGTEPLDAVFVGLGKQEDYAGMDAAYLADKVVFISRGEITFVDKIKIAAEHGAKAAIIFNGNSIQNNDGTIVPDLSDTILGRNGPIGPIAYLGDGYHYIPAFDMPGEQGRALARELINHPDQTLQFTFHNDFELSTIAGDRIADFSSRGPNSDGNYSIKPDVSAPGVNIFSTLPAYGKDQPNVSYKEAYGRLSGTSMAAPHVAGLALLLKQQHRDWSPTDIRAALANTADVINNESNIQYDVYSQGAGRVNIANAIETPAIVQSLDEITIYDEHMKPTTIPSEASSVSFGMLDPDSNLTADKLLQLKNMSKKKTTYKAKIVMHPRVTSDPNDPIATPDVMDIEMSLKGLQGRSSDQITVAPHGKFEFLLTAKATTKTKHGVYEGEVLLESSGFPSLHLPFVIHVGDDSGDNEFAIQNMSLTNPTVTEDSPIDISATLASEDIVYLVAAIFDLNDELVGIIGEIYDFDEEKYIMNPLPAGEIIFPDFNGSYTLNYFSEDWTIVNAKLSKGMYKLAIIGYTDEFEEGDISVAFKSVYAEDEPNAPHK
ncbi:S8 family serine peptidase [Cohnella luojiensis]|uniref:S8 family serine peptidase n=1 Tax=Cohnella luojiensis TaxID=652876 RepID=UPI001431A75D|nr:S8 family serine peptidase [Cohnella luojiensis]